MNDQAGRALRDRMMPCRRRSSHMLSSRPEYDAGWRSIQRMPSAATSHGSQSERSAPGVLATNVDE